jgi:hypothetical protein
MGEEVFDHRLHVVVEAVKTFVCQPGDDSGAGPMTAPLLVSAGQSLEDDRPGKAEGGAAEKGSLLRIGSACSLG